MARQYEGEPRREGGCSGSCHCCPVLPSAWPRLWRHFGFNGQDGCPVLGPEKEAQEVSRQEVS